MRFLTKLLQVALGWAFGMVFTFGHQAKVTVGSVTVPWGVGLALAGTALLVLGVRLFADRTTAGWVAAGVIVAVVVLAMPSPNGTVLVPANLAGTVWAIAPSVLSVLIVLWPASRRSSEA